MPFLDQVITSLNTAWNTNVFGCDQFDGLGVTLNGLAEPILDTSDKEEGQPRLTKFPGLINYSGEVEMIDVNDQKGVIIYHRLESITSQTTSKPAYGDTPDMPLEVINLSAIVIFWRSMLLKPAYWLEDALRDKMPEIVKISDTSGGVLQRSRVKAITSIFDTLGTMAKEYSNIEINYPDLAAFEMKYRVESTLKKGCFDACG